MACTGRVFGANDKVRVPPERAHEGEQDSNKGVVMATAEKVTEAK